MGIVMAIPVNVVVSTVANCHSSLLVTILKLNSQSKDEMRTVKKSSLSKKEIQTAPHSPLVQHHSTSWLSLQQLLLFLYLSLLSHVWLPREEETKHNANVPVFFIFKAPNADL